MSTMGRQKTVNHNLPPRMFPRNGKKQTTYYYRPSLGDRTPINLGHNYEKALKKWAEIEGDTPAPDNPQTFNEVSQCYFRDIVPNKSPATQKDNFRELKKLNEIFKYILLDNIKPKHVRMYMTKRKAKVRANREKALLSHIINYAREHGYSDKPNPCAGIRGNKEKGRDKYVTDAEFKSLYECAHPALQDVLDLMLFTGQRPADCLKMTRADIREGALWVKQNKTGHKLGINITGEFAKAIDRILSRERSVPSMYLVADDNGQPLSYWTLTSRFKKARKGSGVDFQMRDIRAKSATDTGNLETAKQRLGHSTVVMTEHYVKNRKGERVGPLK